MRARLGAMALAVGAMAGAGCSMSSMGPSPVLVSFGSSAGVATGPPAALLVAASRGRIDITGAADTPHPCYTLTAELESSVGQLSLRITARAADNAGCVAVIGRFAYSAAIAVRAGTYSLSIIHTYPNTGWPTTEVLKQTITVD